MKLKKKNYQNLDDEFAKDVDEEVETLRRIKRKKKENLRRKRTTS